MRERRPDPGRSGRKGKTAGGPARAGARAAPAGGPPGASSGLRTALGRLRDAAAAHDGELPVPHLPQVRPSLAREASRFSRRRPGLTTRRPSRAGQGQRVHDPVYGRWRTDIRFDDRLSPPLLRAELLEDVRLGSFRPFRGVQGSTVPVPPDVAAALADRAGPRLGPLDSR